MLINKCSFIKEPHWYPITSEKFHAQAHISTTTEETTDEEKKLDRVKRLDNSIVTGFSLASDNGPLCLEPMIGVAFEIHDIGIDLAIDVEQSVFLYIVMALMFSFHIWSHHWTNYLGHERML